MKIEEFLSKKTSHKFDIYAKNGLMVIIADNTHIVQLCSVIKYPLQSKKGTGYTIGADLLINRDNKDLPEIQKDFLKQFKLIHSFRDKLVYTNKVSFNDLGKMIEKSGELYNKRR